MSARHKQSETVYTVAQAAAILGLSEKDVSNTLDRELAPLGLTSSRDGRRVVARGGLLAIELARAHADRLTRAFRQQIIRRALDAGPRCKTVSEDGIMVNLTEHRARIEASEERLAAARALVDVDPEVMGGEPCIVGTRIPVYMVAGLAEAHGFAETDQCFPTLTHAQVELAMLYVKAHPRSGRPKRLQLPDTPGTTVRRHIPWVD